VGALAHYLEEEGIPTTQVSLVREHTEALVPPRALWVPFILGRPFGVPGDAAFQRAVLLAALRLLESPQGPVLEDYPVDAPDDAVEAVDAGASCPVSFPRMNAEGTLAECLTDEISQLTAWHEVAVRHRGHTVTGLTGLLPGELGAFLCTWLGASPDPTFRADLAPAHALKLATDELKAFYYEAKAAQPGRHAADEIHDWFWMHTSAGRLFLALRQRARESADERMQGFASGSLVPRRVDEALDTGQRG